MHRRRRFRLPVISRLAWAWFGASAAVIAVTLVFFNAAFSGEGASRIALPVERLETMARAPREERLETPPLPKENGQPEEAIDVAMADGDDAEDSLTLIYPGEDDLFTEEDELDGGEVVITIPGKTKTAAPARAASLTPAAAPIPDPDPALLQSTPLGKIPRIAPDGRKAMQYYAKSNQGAPPSGPRISIIVSGLGLNSAVTEQAIDNLPPEVSLSFAPYAKDLEFWTEKARRAGHEVLIELPMEGYGPNSQALGAAALLSSRTEQENLQRLDWLMSRFGGYFAATNYMGAKFSADEAAIAPVLRKLKEAGVAYVDDTGAAHRAGQSVGIPMASVTRVIPASADDAGRSAVRRELAALEAAAKRDGAAIGKTYAYAATIDEIAAWAASLEEKGLAPAPASALLRTARASR